MADLLWQKPGVAVDAQIQRFLAGDDVILDREFFLHDIAASRAHAQGLQRIGILSQGELDGLERELAILADDFRSGRKPVLLMGVKCAEGHSFSDCNKLLIASHERAKMHIHPVTRDGRITPAINNLGLFLDRWLGHGGLLSSCAVQRDVQG